MIIGDTVGPLPKGISHIMRMTLLAPKFGYLDLAREPILFLMPSFRGACSIRVTTTLATLTPSAPMPSAGVSFRDGGIGGYPIIIRKSIANRVSPRLILLSEWQRSGLGLEWSGSDRERRVQPHGGEPVL